VHIDDVRRAFREHGAGARHEPLLLRQWACARPLATAHPRPEDFFPRTLRDAMPALQALLDGLARARSTHPGQDGSARLLVDLADGQSVESVLSVACSA
jgi:23S rRNA (adenine2503-C2)-methyltransferase